MINILLILHNLAEAQRAQLDHDYNVKPVPFNHVKIEDRFWTDCLETSRSVTIPYAFEKCEETDRIGNFEKAAGVRGRLKPAS